MLGTFFAVTEVGIPIETRLPNAFHHAVTPLALPTSVHSSDGTQERKYMTVILT